MKAEAHEQQRRDGVIKVRADLDKCEGYANCIMAAPDVFDINDEGTVVLLRTEIDDTEQARVGESVRSCPTAALSLEQDQQ